MAKIPSNKPLIGAHVSVAGGFWHAPKNAHKLGCETFQIFSRSPHGGQAAEINEDVSEKFWGEMKKHGFKNFVIHAPYFVNLGSSTPRIYNGSVGIIKNELERGTGLGAEFLMFHPGSFKDLGQKKGMQQAQEALLRILDGYKGTTKLLIEISAGAGSIIGDTFEELAELTDAVKRHKGFGGICFDTQHAFGSGYDLRTEEAVEKTMKSFDKIIGLKYLKMMHVNDSKVDLGSHKDRHEHIGEGQIGEVGFFAIMRFLKKKKLAIPLILETQHDKVVKDIKLLKALRAKAWK